MSAADQHPFVAWVREHHGKADNVFGDFATEITPTLPATGTRERLRERVSNLAPEWAVDAFDVLWAQYEADTAHPFVAWMRRQDGKEWRQGTPLGDFAREFAPLFPAEGDRATLRRTVANVVGADPLRDTWTLSCFDVAWRQYDPKCAAPDCNHHAAEGMSLCAVHAPLEELL